MKLRNLSIALAITLSPIINAGPVKWFKDNAVPIAIGFAGISAAVIYISQSDDNNIKQEAYNSSPRHEQFDLENKDLLRNARKHSEERLPRESAKKNCADEKQDDKPKIYKSDKGDQVFEFSNDTTLVREYNKEAKPTKSALKKTTHAILIDRSKIK